jgi:2,3-bisphosphoglycerate-independent phosphoglycerate mutase
LRTLLIFIDGVGLGDSLPANPFILNETPSLKALLRGSPMSRDAIGFSDERVSLLGLDALMGIRGLPQSATGQASIFTGENVPGLLGSHLNGFPNTALRKILAEKGMFKQLRARGCRCIFANAYRPQFFELLRQGLPGLHYSCSTLITYYGGLPFHSLEHLHEGKAIYMDIDNSLLQQMDETIERITPEDSGRRLVHISDQHDFTLFEYFLSDLAGHAADLNQARQVVETLDRFLGAVIEGLDPAKTLLIVSSDHGNLEDLSHQDHTNNPVPALLVGNRALRQAIAPAMHNLTHILPAIKKALVWT